jgi:8-oxo-dGTP pyrophosphatase MutT (NUDIX family)
MHPALQRHIDLCNNIRLPAGRTKFAIGNAEVGWIDPRILPALLACDAISRNGDSVVLAADRAGELGEIGRSIAAQGFYRHRGEAFDVREGAEGRTLATLDRGALPAFGVAAIGVHVNGLVRRPDGLHLWVARRAANKMLDPGKLDHIVAGGVSAGMTAEETLIKEAGEEAAIPAELARQAKLAGKIGYTMLRPEGLRRDTLYCYDLELPEDFVPHAADGEVESFELWPIARALDTVLADDGFKFNVNLVLIDLFARLGLGV